jgi:hypothetical protein
LPSPRELSEYPQHCTAPVVRRAQDMPHSPPVVSAWTSAAKPVWGARRRIRLVLAGDSPAPHAAVLEQRARAGRLVRPDANRGSRQGKGAQGQTGSHPGLRTARRRRL